MTRRGDPALAPPVEPHLPRPSPDTSASELVVTTSVLVLLAFSTYYISRQFVIAQAFIQVAVLAYFILLSRQYPQVQTHGWSYILIGVNLVTFGAFIEISSFVPFLRSSLTDESAPFRHFLKQVVGNNTGLLLIAFGFYRWVPSFLASRRVLDELLRKYEQQVIRNEKLNSLAGLVAGVAHELNNPLSIVLGYVEVLKDTCASQDQREAVEQLRNAAHRCKKIAGNLLSFACQPVMERRAVQLPAIVEEVLELLGSALERHGIAVEQDVPPALPPVLADRDQLLQVFFNLLKNAVQALSGHDGPRRIAVAMRANESAVEASIVDSGPGIPDEHLEKIFQPFFTTKRAGEGTGLGLSVCFGIVKAHGGSIRVESGPGVSTRFTCELPVARMTGGDAPSSGSPDVAGVDGLEVLLLDDEPALIATVGEYLARRGALVDRCTTGRAALAKLAIKEYDAIVLDVRMASMSGFDVFEEIGRRWPRLAERVIFATGDAGHEDTIRLLRASRRPYILKPFTGDALADLIARSVRESRA